MAAGKNNGLRLRITGPDGATMETIADAESVIVGSGAQAAVKIQDPSVSNLHVMLKVDKEGGVTAIDLGSESGTQVGGQRLMVPKVLVPGDVLTARALTRGQSITMDDIAMQRLDLTLLQRGVFTDLQQLIGKVAKSAVAGGTPLRADLLRSAAVVTQGQQVRVVFSGPGFHVSSEGRALGTAGVGESVQVRTASGKLIKGIVSAPGVVQVQ